MMASNLSLSDISGEIENTISSASLNNEDRTRIQIVRQWLSKRRSELKPWSEFLNTRKFSKPKSAAEITKRVATNIRLYQANYFAVFIFLAIYCIITNPLLLFGLSVSLGGSYYISTRGNGQPMKLFGRQLSATEQYGLVLLISIPLFFLASAGSTVFWIIGASIFVTLAHASMLSIASTDSSTDFEMQGIEVQ